MDKRKCAARECPRRIDKKFLMCAYHWRLVPSEVQLQVHQSYRRGQEEDLAKVSTRYRDAMMAAIDAVAKKERPVGVHL